MPGASIVALLFTDVVGSTMMYERLGDEAAEALRRSHFDSLRVVIEQAEGTEVKNLGDGLMVVFPSVISALAAAVEMQRRSVSGTGERVDIRIGVHVGEPMTDDDDYFGMPVTIARRLCDSAEAGQILVSDLVHALVRSRSAASRPELRPVGQITLKGLADPVAAFEVPWEPDAANVTPPMPSALEAASRGAWIIGRDTELAVIEQAHKELGASPSLVLVRGEPGIGKTRLTAEAARRLAAQSSVVLYGRCDEEPLSSYQPFVEALTHLARHVSGDSLTSALGVHAESLARVVPAIAERLGIATSSGGELERSSLFEGVTRGLLATDPSPERPVVLVLDDLHWADAPTLALLRHLCRTENAPVLIVATYRDTDLSRKHPLAACIGDWRREGTGTWIDLDGLAEDEVGDLLFGTDDRDSDLAALVAQVARETEGNPFFTIEMGRHLFDTHAVVKEDHGVRVIGQLDLLVLPEGVRQVIGRRLSRLSEECNRVIGVASVLGRSFGLVDAASAAGADEVDVLGLVEAALAARILVEVPGAPDTFSFAHALIRQTLYDELPISRRLRIHLAHARRLVERDASEAEVAHHFLEAVPAVGATEAAMWALRGATFAVERIAGFEDGIALASRGLAMLDDASEDAPALRCDLLLARCVAAIGVGLVDGPMRDALAAAALAQDLNDPERLARAAILPARAYGPLMDPINGALLDELIEAALTHPRLDPVDRARLVPVAWWRDQSADPDAALAALATARRLNDPEALGYALLVRCDSIGTQPGSVDEQLALLQEVEELPPLAGLAGGIAPSRSRVLMAQWKAGRRDETVDALTRLQDKVALHPTAVALNMLIVVDAMCAYAEGRLADAEAGAVRVLTAETPSMIARVQAGATMLLIRREQLRAAEGVLMLRAAVDAMPAIDAYRAGLAAMLVETGGIEEARGLLDGLDLGQLLRQPTGLVGAALFADAAVRAGTDGHRTAALEMLEPYSGWQAVTFGAPLAPVDHYIGLLHVAAGRLDEAAAAFASARRVETDFGAALWEGYTLAAWAHASDDEQLAAEARSLAARLDVPRLSSAVATL